ncbi:MAG: BamA/TamA family outer membrane protein [Saprospiraceae bacterium]|nr:BamA/TamA family outer membrane protein [Saprospiraceae bacterium]
MTAFLKLLLTMLAVSFAAVQAHAQTFEENRDITDVIRDWRNKPAPSLSPDIVVGKNYISILPVIGYAPANGFLIGTAMSISRMVDKPPTKMSSGMVNMQLTSKKQFIVNARSKIYLKNNTWFLQGDWRFMLFAQPTYGLGIVQSGGNKYLLAINELPNNLPPNAEDMRYNYLRFYEDVVKQMGDKNLYIGLGLAIDIHSKIIDQKLDTDTSSENFYITNHYAYSEKYGFDSSKYITNGFNLNILSDTRDHIANPYSGYYASFSLRYNPRVSKSSQESMLANYDFRYYMGLSQDKKRHLLAFWSYGTFKLLGNVPYLALPSIGWDTYNRSGRGYVQGRYRGFDMVYMEAEYRFPLSNNGMWGGVAFLNNTLASAPDQKLFEKTAPGLGVGLRMKMDKRARVNLTVDYGVGLDKSSGIYFSMQETF